MQLTQLHACHQHSNHTIRFRPDMPANIQQISGTGWISKTWIRYIPITNSTYWQPNRKHTTTVTKKFLKTSWYSAKKKILVFSWKEHPDIQLERTLWYSAGKSLMVSNNKWKTTVKLNIKLFLAVHTMLKPALGTLKCQRLILYVKLVNKKLMPVPKVAQVANSQNTNPADISSSAAFTRIHRPLDIDSHEFLSVRIS